MTGERYAFLRGPLPTPDPAKIAMAPAGGFGQAFSAAVDETLAAGLTISSQIYLKRARDENVARIAKATGRDPRDALNDAYAAAHGRPMPRAVDPVPGGPSRMDVEDEATALLAGSLPPETGAGILTGKALELRARELQLEAYHDAQQRQAAASGTFAGIGEAAGGIAGSMLDPVNVATMAMGAPAVTTFWRGLALDVGMNVFAEALTLPGINAERVKLGIEPLDPATQLMAAAVAGGVFSGVLRGAPLALRGAKRLGADALARRTGLLSKKKIAELYGELREEQGGGRSADPIAELLDREAGVAAARPDGIDPIQHEQKIRAAAEAIERGDFRALPEATDLRPRNPNLTERQEDFLDLIGPGAQAVAAETGVDWRIIVAQSALETGWGKHAPGNNFFGVKGGGQTQKTREFQDGEFLAIFDRFRAYDSAAASVADYGKVIEGPRYKAFREAEGLDAQLEALQAAGYATDPEYAAKVGRIARGLDSPLARGEQPPLIAPHRPAEGLGDAAGVAPIQRADLPPADALERGRVDARDIERDAALFQFKAGGDADGVTDRLKGVERWQPAFAGAVMLWRRADGRMFVADGHQRVGLARRLLEAGKEDEVRIDALIYSEDAGWSAGDLRALAAAKNIAEGTGSAVDAAKVFRDRPELALDLPPNGALVRDGKGLARLSDDAFGLVVNDKVDADHAAILGRIAPGRRDVHAQVLIEVGKAKPANQVEAESMIRDLLAAPEVRQIQIDLFGAEETGKLLLKERARILAATARELRQDKQAFKTVALHADRLAEAGNTIEAAASLTRAEEDARLLDTLQRLARTRGPIADALAGGARDLRDGVKLRDIVGSVRAAVRRQAPGADAPGGPGGGVRRGAEGGGGSPADGARSVSDDTDPASARSEPGPVGDREGLTAADPAPGSGPKNEALARAVADGNGFDAGAGSAASAAQGERMLAQERALQAEEADILSGLRARGDEVFVDVDGVERRASDIVADIEAQMDFLGDLEVVCKVGAAA